MRGGACQGEMMVNFICEWLGSGMELTFVFLEWRGEGYGTMPVKEENGEA